MKIKIVDKGIFVERETLETNIKLSLFNDGFGTFNGETPIGFFNHMLNTFCRYSRLSINLERCVGDIDVDFHHTIEDVGIVLGTAFKNLFDYKKLKRFGNSTIPMDDALVSVYIDLSGRPFLNFNVDFGEQLTIGNLPVELIKEFFQAFVNNSGITLHAIKLFGYNSHHIAEALFKAFAVSVKMATEPSNFVSTTKGVID
ncbi:MAG: imidazoleglycerol-phosphate dehydratase [Thermotogaceae bacterium]|jgi:imidazoleglycerol-phosphate dehydratase|nr:imidazoleglycerol-phosphate dehydratase [Thermotogaceae bacterium]MDN5336935.1 imidazoleglycerol-phosphate dehydratase [Thermotogaceae bacterium]